MRTKSFVVFLICVVATSLFLILVGNQRPSIQTIVTETHKQLNNLKNFKNNLNNAQEKKLLADEKYLNLLGFGDHPRLYPTAIWRNTSLPVVVSYVLDGREQLGVGLARNIAHFLPNHTLIIYTFGLASYALQVLTSHCNSSRCNVVTFDLSLFPSHVEEERVRAFRPLIIQDALNKAGGVLFMECDLRLTTPRIDALVARAVSVGVAAWTTHRATSSLTHPKMFDYFQTTADDFLFLPMVDASKLVVFNSEFVHTRVMLPWVQCALTQDCLHPIGAQDGGCRFNKKPQYRYSGCHRYDVSALSIVLGLGFELDDARYAYRGAEPAFRRVSAESAAQEMSALEGNVTDPSAPL